MLNDIQKEKLSDEELDSVSGGVNIMTNLPFNSNQEFDTDGLVASSEMRFSVTDLLEKDPKFRRSRRRNRQIEKGSASQNGGLQSL